MKLDPKNTPAAARASVQHNLPVHVLLLGLRATGYTLTLPRQYTGPVMNVSQTYLLQLLTTLLLRRHVDPGPGVLTQQPRFTRACATIAQCSTCLNFAIVALTATALHSSIRNMSRARNQPVLAYDFRPWWQWLA